MLFKILILSIFNKRVATTDFIRFIFKYYKRYNLNMFLFYIICFTVYIPFICSIILDNTGTVLFIMLFKN